MAPFNELKKKVEIVIFIFFLNKRKKAYRQVILYFDSDERTK